MSAAERRHSAAATLARTCSGVLALAVAATGRPRGWHGWSIGALAALFFVFLYADEIALNRFEDRMAAAVEQLPSMARVVETLEPEEKRVPILASPGIAVDYLATVL